MAASSWSPRTYESNVNWVDGLERGEGRFELGSGSLTGIFDHESRYRQGFDTAPEEMLAAALATCFTMTLVERLIAGGHHVRGIHTRVVVRIRRDRREKHVIDELSVFTHGDVAGIEEQAFHDVARAAGKRSPIARALCDGSIHIDSRLDGGGPDGG